MPKCPECSEEIDFLKYYQKVEEVSTFKAFKPEEGGPEYTHYNTLSTDDSGEWECPECSEVLFRNEKDASKFLLEE